MCCEVWERYRNRVVIPWVLLCVSLGIAEDMNKVDSVIIAWVLLCVERG